MHDGGVNQTYTSTSGESIMCTSSSGGNSVLWITRFYYANNTEVLRGGACAVQRGWKMLPLRRPAADMRVHPQAPDWWNSVFRVAPVNSQVHALRGNWPRATVFVCCLCFSFQQCGFFTSLRKKSTQREGVMSLEPTILYLFLSHILCAHSQPLHAVSLLPLPLGIQKSSPLCRALQLFQISNSKIAQQALQNILESIVRPTVFLEGSSMTRFYYCFSYSMSGANIQLKGLKIIIYIVWWNVTQLLGLSVTST